ncbi:hypothetical protein BpHYR1_032436, partial [Brachionus plicatilis]
MKIFFMMHKSVETDLYNKKCEIINSLIELIELRTKYRFNFDFKFIRPDVTNLQCSTSKAVMLPDDFDGKWSSRSSLDKPRLSDSECELNNNQFKQYTKVTLKNLLNKSPNSKKNKNELLQSRNEDLLKETALKNSEFCKSVVEDIVANSMNTVQSMIKKYSELAQNLVESSVDDGLDEMRKIIQIRKINELYLKCDCVNMNQYCRKKDRLDCKLLIYLICSVLEEMNFTNSAIFECKNYQLMKKLTGLAFEIYETHSQKKKLASSQQFYN